MTRQFLKLLVGAAVSAAAPMALADDLAFEAHLSGAQEAVFDAGGNFVPGGVDTPATGSVKARFDKGLSRVFVSLRVNELTGGFLASHFHCGLPGQNGPIAFGLVNPGPLFIDGDRVRGELTNLAYTGANCVPIVGRPVNNIAALAQAMEAGLIYINVHTSFAPGGEIRGQMTEADDDDGPGRGRDDKDAGRGRWDD